MKDSPEFGLRAVADGKTGIAIRFVKQWDIAPDQKPFRSDLYVSADRSKCPKCHADAYVTPGGMWHCDPCAIGWEQA